MSWFNKNGGVNKKIVCKHCGTGGCVRTRKEKQRRGISPTKVVGQSAAAFLTGGLSLIFAPHVGICNMVEVTVFHCDVCKVDWASDGGSK